MNDLDFKELNDLMLAENLEKPPQTIEQVIEWIKKSIVVGFFIEASSKLTIETLQDARSAVEMTNQARKASNSLERARNEILRPQIDFQKAINEIVQNVQDEFEKIEENITKKLQAWKESNNSSISKIDTDDGSMTITKKWKYNFYDEQAIPHEYMSPDKKKIEAAIKAGIRNIPGIEIFEKEEINFRVKN